VFDPFMGSGTTGKAARMLDHDFLGFELDATMCRVAHEYVFGQDSAQEKLFCEQD
jgi:DNA modification methylase